MLCGRVSRQKTPKMASFLLVSLLNQSQKGTQERPPPTLRETSAMPPATPVYATRLRACARATRRHGHCGAGHRKAPGPASQDHVGCRLLLGPPPPSPFGFKRSWESNLKSPIQTTNEGLMLTPYFHQPLFISIGRGGKKAWGPLQKWSDSPLNPGSPHINVPQKVGFPSGFPRWNLQKFRCEGKPPHFAAFEDQLSQNQDPDR